MNNNIEVTCVDDSMRPNEIPFTNWVKKDEIYHIVKIIRCMGGVVGVELAEIDLKPYFPYKYFKLGRFGLSQAQLESYLEKVEIPEEELV
jgi:hypothetical protein